jgi:hypothetical protein
VPHLFYLTASAVVAPLPTLSAHREYLERTQAGMVEAACCATHVPQLVMIFETKLRATALCCFAEKFQ